MLSRNRSSSTRRLKPGFTWMSAYRMNMPVSERLMTPALIICLNEFILCCFLCSRPFGACCAPHILGRHPSAIQGRNATIHRGGLIPCCLLPFFYLPGNALLLFSKIADIPFVALDPFAFSLAGAVFDLLAQCAQ